MLKSEKLFNTAKELIPGGVNSPVRAFGSVDEIPRYIDYAKGSKVYDIEGNQYIDYVGSWGPMILGHAYPDIIATVSKVAQKGLSFGACIEAEVEMAKLMCSMVPSVEMVRMVNSGTEAVMSAIRLARGYTQKNKIVKFEGCYHGHSDSMLVSAGSGLMSSGIQNSAGVPIGCAQDTLIAEFNNMKTVENLFEKYKGEIAAVILEIVPANMGLVLPESEFLEGIRKLCDENSSLLIADEVITGFRLGIGGAQEHFNVRADITIFGKIIGGGMPVGAYGGRKDVMSMISPSGNVYQAGTLSGNPIAMAAGIAQLSILNSNPQIYDYINNLATKLSEGLKEIIINNRVDAIVKSIGSLSCIYFTDRDVINYQNAKTSNTERYKKYFKGMLNKGIYLAPSQFEVSFISNSHTAEDIEYTLECADEVLRDI